MLFEEETVKVVHCFQLKNEIVLLSITSALVCFSEEQQQHQK